MTTDDETEAANRMQAAFEAVHEAVLRLLQYVVLAAAGVTGELGADVAQAGRMDVEPILADVTRSWGRPAPAITSYCGPQSSP